ncbi:hypothetical protein Gorai_017587, partial [Gossypium raimondii]|nr:hypothetical protein [Gossypium raimondii]
NSNQVPCISLQVLVKAALKCLQGKNQWRKRIVHIDDIDPCHMDPCPSSACKHGGQGLETSFLVFYWFLIHFSLVSFDKGIMMDMELLQCDKELLAFGGSWNRKM